MPRIHWVFWNVKFIELTEGEKDLQKGGDAQSRRRRAQRERPQNRFAAQGRIAQPAQPARRLRPAPTLPARHNTLRTRRAGLARMERPAGGLPAFGRNRRLSGVDLQ